MSNFEISTEDKSEIIDTFNTLAEALINSEREGGEKYHDIIMRHLHNLKGTMQMIGYNQMGEFIHLLETKFEECVGAIHHSLIDQYLIAINSLEQHFIDEMDCYDDHLYQSIERIGREGVKRTSLKTLISDIADEVHKESEESLISYEKINSSIISEDVGVVFVLDDEEEILKSIKEAFSNLNMLVITFSNYESLKSNLNDIKPDLVMIDYHLNGYKGVDIYNLYLKHKEIPTIFMTSDLSKSTFEDIIVGKSVFFLEKPLRYYEMISSVISALEQGKMKRMLEKMIDLERTILSHFPEIKESLEEKEDFKSIFEIREAYRMLMKYRKVLIK